MLWRAQPAARATSSIVVRAGPWRATPCCRSGRDGRDRGQTPRRPHPRRAYDLLAKGFGPGFNEPLLVVASLPGPGSVGALAPLLSRLAQVPGVAIVTPPRLNA